MTHDRILPAPALHTALFPIRTSLALRCHKTGIPPENIVSAQPANADADDAWQNELLHRLREMGVTGYEQIIALLLQAHGYEHVQVMRSPQVQAAKALRQSRKGRNRHGGVDIVATGRAGLSSGTVLAQVKQYARPVSRRFVDELRGAILRREARHGLLVTTSVFAPAAVEAAQEDHVAPVYLVDGGMLCRLLASHRIGVKSDGKGNWLIDDAFLDSFESA